MDGGGGCSGDVAGRGRKQQADGGRADWDGRSVARPDRQADGRVGGQPGARTAGRADGRAGAAAG